MACYRGLREGKVLLRECCYVKLCSKTGGEGGCCENGRYDVFTADRGSLREEGDAVKLKGMA